MSNVIFVGIKWTFYCQLSIFHIHMQGWYVDKTFLLLRGCYLMSPRHLCKTVVQYCGYYVSFLVTAIIHVVKRKMWNHCSDYPSQSAMCYLDCNRLLPHNICWGSVRHVSAMVNVINMLIELRFFMSNVIFVGAKWKIYCQFSIFHIHMQGFNVDKTFLLCGGCYLMSPPHLCKILVQYYGYYVSFILTAVIHVVLRKLWNYGSDYPSQSVMCYNDYIRLLLHNICSGSVGHISAMANVKNMPIELWFFMSNVIFVVIEWTFSCQFSIFYHLIWKYSISKTFYLFQGVN